MSRRRESGYAVLTSLLVIFLLAVALALLAGSLQLRMRLARQDGQSVILSALSDAAVAEAVANLARSASYSGSPKHEFGGGVIASEATSVGSGVFRVVATAKYAQRERVVEVEVFRAPGVARVHRWWRRPG
ncbi:MAG TPA: hypothetical protein VKK31_31850 [Thermoanaerobaculia bacterium]|nr:hypothetical protein [Thermoanaerobaculia bacterium]